MGQSLFGVDLDHRVSLLQSIIAPNHYHPDAALDPFQIQLKDFVEYSQLVSFIDDHLPTLPYAHKVSGVIFRPTNHSNKNLIFNFPRESKSHQGQVLIPSQRAQHGTNVPRAVQDTRDARDSRGPVPPWTPVRHVSIKRHAPMLKLRCQ